jgi:uncharacterized protein with beta-barrel porin domain
MINSTISAGATVTDLGSNFLERLGTTNGFSRMLRTNPGGGGASESNEAPRYRTWFEGYGISATNGPLGLFVGDNRKTWGGVAGIGARVAPGINVGFSVDQSRTSIDVPLALQSATSDQHRGTLASRAVIRPRAILLQNDCALVVEAD